MERRALRRIHQSSRRSLDLAVDRSPRVGQPCIPLFRLIRVFDDGKSRDKDLWQQGLVNIQADFETEARTPYDEKLSAQ